MTLDKTKLINGFKRFWRVDRGAATVEFALLFPAFMTIFLMSVELGVLLTRKVMLNRGVDISMRELRLGTLSPMTHEGLKKAICNNAAIIPDCLNAVLIELNPISTTTWAGMTNAATCVDRTQTVQPVLQFQTGASNELMMVRVCAVFDPYFPTGALASSMQLDASNAYAMVTTSAYVNEP